MQLDTRGSELLFRILTEREEKSSIALASNLPLSEWGQVIPDARLVAAIVDRVTFNAHIIETGTESYGVDEVEPADLPCFARPARLVWMKQRWRCANPMCRVVTFAETDGRIAADRAAITDPKRIGDVTAVGLDEVLFCRIGPFKHRAWSTQVVDVARGQLLDVVPGRNAAGVCAWLPNWSVLATPRRNPKRRMSTSSGGSANLVAERRA